MSRPDRGADTPITLTISQLTDVYLKYGIGMVVTPVPVLLSLPIVRVFEGYGLLLLPRVYLPGSGFVIVILVVILVMLVIVALVLVLMVILGGNAHTSGNKQAYTQRNGTQ